MPRNSSCRKFGKLRNFRRLHCSSCLPLFTFQPLFLPAACFCFLSLLVFFLFCPNCNSVCNVIFVICKGGLAIKAPRQALYRILTFLLSNKIGGKLSAFLLFSSFSHFLSFSLIFWATKHPLRMTTRRMVG